MLAEMFVTEMPHVPVGKPVTVPGTTVTLSTFADFRFERDDRTRDRQGELSQALQGAGLVWKTSKGEFVRAHVRRGDLAIERIPEKHAGKFKRLPDGWEQQLRMGFGESLDEARLSLGTPTSQTVGEVGYYYHVTNEERARDIAGSRLDTHRPDWGTDQEAWPDGSTERRAYFVGHQSAKNAWQFAPEEGKAVLLRVPASAAQFKRESTGDYYVTRPIPAANIEVFGEKGWVPLKKLREAVESLDEVVQALRDFLLPSYAVFSLGPVGWFDTYYAHKVSEDEYDLLVTELGMSFGPWTKKVHDPKDPDVPEKLLSAPGLLKLRDYKATIKQAVGTLQRLGFPRQRETLIITDLTSHVNKITGGGMGGYAAPKKHGVVVGIGMMGEVDALVHEWAHMYWFRLPKGSRDYFQRWYDANVIAPAAKELARGIPSDVKRSICGQLALEVGMTHARDKFGMNFQQLFNTRLAAKSKTPEKVVLDYVREKFERVDISLYGDLKRDLPPAAGSKIDAGYGTKHSEVFMVIDPDDPKKARVHSRVNYEYINRIPKDKVDDYLKLDLEWTERMNTGENFDAMRAEAESESITNKLSRMLDVAIFGAADEIKSQFTEYGIWPINVFGGDALPRIIDNFVKRWNYQERLGKKWDPEKALQHELRMNGNWKAAADNPEQTVVATINAPEGERLRQAAAARGLPTSYAAANVRELWAVTVEYAAKHEVSKELKKALYNVLQGNVSEVYTMSRFFVNEGSLADLFAEVRVRNLMPVSEADEWDAVGGRKKVVGKLPSGKLMVTVPGVKYPYLFTPEELEKEQARDAKALVAHAAAQEKSTSAKAQADAVKANIEDTDGYADKMPAMQKAKAIHALQTKVNYHGKLISRRDLIRAKVADGAIMVRGALELPDGVFLDKRALTDTGLRYAAHLIKLKEAVGESAPILRFSDLLDEAGPSHTNMYSHVVKGEQQVVDLGKHGRFYGYSAMPLKGADPKKIMSVAEYKKAVKDGTAQPDEIVDKFDVGHYLTACSKAMDDLKVPKRDISVVFARYPHGKSVSGWMYPAQLEGPIYLERKPSDKALGKYAAYKGPRAPHTLLHEYAHVIWYKDLSSAQQKAIRNYWTVNVTSDPAKALADNISPTEYGIYGGNNPQPWTEWWSEIAGYSMYSGRLNPAVEQFAKDLLTGKLKEVPAAAAAGSKEKTIGQPAPPEPKLDAVAQKVKGLLDKLDAKIKQVAGDYLVQYRPDGTVRVIPKKNHKDASMLALLAQVLGFDKSDAFGLKARPSTGSQGGLVLYQEGVDIESTLAEIAEEDVHFEWFVTDSLVDAFVTES